MIWLIFAILLIFGVVALLASYTVVGGVIQFLLISVLLALGINRIRRYRVHQRFRLRSGLRILGFKNG